MPEKILFDKRIGVFRDKDRQHYAVRVVQNPNQDAEGFLTCASPYVPRQLRNYASKVSKGDRFFEALRIHSRVQPVSGMTRMPYIGLIVTEISAANLVCAVGNYKSYGVHPVSFIREGKLWLPNGV